MGENESKIYTILMLGGYGTFPISCKDLDQIILESCDNAFIFAK